MTLGGGSSVITVMLLTGLAGSVGHCLGMCGPLVIVVGARYPRQGFASAPLHLLYHTGRILMYAMLGIMVGALGGAVGKAAAAARIPGLLSLLIGIAVIAAGLSYLGLLPFWSRSLHSGGWWLRVMKNLMKTPGTAGVFLLGLLNGLLPCGLVYEALLIGATAGGPLVSGLGMLAFGAATMPAMVVFGMGAQMLSARVRRTLVWVGGAFVVLVGVDLTLRGVAGLGLVPEALLQKVFFW